MQALNTCPLARRPDLVISAQGNSGRHVVKDPTTNDFYTLGEHESFLLLRFDGTQTDVDIRTAFEQRFGQPLSSEDLEGFVALAESRDLLLANNRQAALGGNGSLAAKNASNGNSQPAVPPPGPLATQRTATPRPPSGQSILRWRKCLIDPDRLFTWLAPKLRLVWTRTFLVCSLACITSASVLVGLNGQELVTSFANALRWETILLVWLTLLLATLCHEFAHGLTCKHYGGEVHEVGVMVLFMMPCFYCNVTDAWLFRERSKRLWVTLAGGYCDLCVWALSIFIWRLTMQDSIVNYVASVVFSVLSTRLIFNFNPLIKLDGYYLLSDFLEIPNLQQRAVVFLKAYLRWLLWGGQRPASEDKGKVLLMYGIVSWVFSLAFMAFMLVATVRFLGESWGVIGIVSAMLLGAFVVQGLVQGLFGDEFLQMLLQRRKRVVLWSAALAIGLAFLAFGQMDDRASGTVRVYPLLRTELRAPVAGFLREVRFDEGSRVPPGAVVLRLEVPNLASLKYQKQAEVQEAEARLRLLEVGSRPEEVAVQRSRVERAQAWRDLAKRDLEHVEESVAAELSRLDQQIAQQQFELDYAIEAFARSRQLFSSHAISKDEHLQAEKKLRVNRVQLEQAESQQRARKALGTREAEAELARRDRDLADAQGALSLLEAGTRPEEMDAERSRLVRAKQDLGYLDEVQKKAIVYCSAGGIMTTPRLAEKIGQYFHEGELIGAIEDATVVEGEITLADQESARVLLGQMVELKVRARPTQVFRSEVDRIASRAGTGEVQSTIVLYCRLDNPSSELRPGMIGYASIHCGRRPIRTVLADRVLRWLRTEFWW